MRIYLLATAITALTAVLLTFLVLTFVANNPWMLVGVAAVLYAIAEIVRAVNGTPRDRKDDDDHRHNGS